jgi:hypothetical protein
VVAQRYPSSETGHIEIYGRMGTVVAQMKNISESGAFFEMTQGEYIPKKGDFVHITIHLHSIGKSRSFDAEVIWNQGLGFGARFMKKSALLERLFQRSEV